MTTILLLCLLQEAAEQNKIADIKSFTGGVSVAGVDGQSRQPAKVGRRFRNTSLFDEDRVETQPGAECEVLFPDDSTVTLKENSQIQILQKQLPSANPDGKTIGRRIRLLVGEMVTDVVPNKNIQTDFETPSGTAAVRGTAGTISVNPATGAVTITVTEGTFHFYNSSGQVLFSLQAGQSAQFSIAADGGLSVMALGTPITGQIGDTNVRLDGDGHVEVDVRDGRVHANPLGGDVEFEGEGGVWTDLNEDFQCDMDPAIGDNFDPTADPFFELMFEDPLFAEMFFEEDLFFFNEFEFNANDIGTQVDEEFEQDLLHPSFHAILEASRLIVHIHDDMFFLPWDPGAPDGAGMFNDMDAESAFHAGVPLDAVVDLALTHIHDGWHAGIGSDPSVPPSRHDLFHDDPVDPFGFDDLDADLRLWASQAQAGIFDDHLLGHVLIGVVHQDFHITHDYEVDDAIYIPDHGAFHADLNEMHAMLHSSDLHGFIHGSMDVLHDNWHLNAEATAGCSAVDFATPGTTCHQAHEHFHEHMNAFHDHLHTAFGIP